jgi:ABC-type transporter Mla subunit MlaD
MHMKQKYIKRMTIGVTEANHKKVADLTDELGLSNQWDTVNLIIESFDSKNSAFVELLKNHKTRLGLTKAREKQFKATMEALPANVKDQLASLTPDEILKKLGL